MQYIKILDDGRCDCGAADTCPLGRRGLNLRCTIEELKAAGGTSSTAGPKPPLGVVPQYIHQQHRANDLVDAISRNVDADRKPNPAWFFELRQITEDLPRAAISRANSGFKDME